MTGGTLALYIGTLHIIGGQFLGAVLAGGELLNTVVIALLQCLFLGFQGTVIELVNISIFIQSLGSRGIIKACHKSPPFLE